jgi:hypothetical protein
MPTTWNPADLLNVTLSGTNSLTATRSGSGGGGVRTLFSTNTGKYYFEYTCTTWSGSVGVGIANATANLATVGNTPTNACIASPSGIIYMGSTTGFTLGARANGDIIGVAIDLGGRLIWLRVAPSGNWNGNATHNPGTGAGGINLTAISTGTTPMFGLFGHNSIVSAITANFGDTAFSGAVPSGFAAGFPAPVTATAGPRQSLVM